MHDVYFLDQNRYLAEVVSGVSIIKQHSVLIVLPDTLTTTLHFLLCSVLILGSRDHQEEDCWGTAEYLGHQGSRSNPAWMGWKILLFAFRIPLFPWVALPEIPFKSYSGTADLRPVHQGTFNWISVLFNCSGPNDSEMVQSCPCNTCHQCAEEKQSA